ncbi:lactate utilization protein [Xylanibacter oryzae]|uniref:lactate utilization protein n=1 Tax=Xylanibacter oryzae TaxID=185293 RepID=UPI0004AD2C11|nr:lactate utilization protein [Xylanibacter oryzae]
MENPAEIRNEKLAQKLIKNLSQRHYDAYYCKTSKDALKKAIQLIPQGSSVSWGGSATLNEIGLIKALKDGIYKVYDRENSATQKEKREMSLKAFDCDYYLSSVNAMSEDGVFVNIDGSGNRVAAITWGPEHVILVVGINKICQDVDAAIKRARSTAAPINTARFDVKTPCIIDGTCHDCKSADSICAYVSIQRLSRPAKRHIVILVGEDLGY